MLGVILVNQGSNQTSELNSKRLSESGFERIEFINCKDTALEDLGAMIKVAAAKLDCDQVICIDGNFPIEADCADAIYEQSHADLSANFTYFPIKTEQTCYEYCTPSIDNIVPRLNQEQALPLACCLISLPLLENLSSRRGLSLQELLGSILVGALAEGEHVAQAEKFLTCSESNYSIELSSSERAKLLKAAIDSANIEELFPNFAWPQHQEESAALCFHTLAAQFIKFGDHDSAVECLALGDELEDSPRSQALKGLIAREKGETLAAVAQMVASLQHYEVRKKESGHYISFSTSNIQNINEILQEGLSALNKRDNNTALQHFYQAVSEFDGFYQECGLGERKG